MKKVIVIDDDDDLRESFSMLLSLNEFQVLATGKDGKEAIELYQKLKPDFIFLDYNMPNFDGMYALKEIRRIDPKSKIIIITGTCENHKIFLEKGAIAIFSKPVVPKEILRKIEEYDFLETIDSFLEE